jgi:hypothetical protein
MPKFAKSMKPEVPSGGSGPAVTITSPPTHAELASRVSTHREAVTREPADLAELERLVREVGER